MTYYVFRLTWSQTDSELVIVQANSEQAARDKLKSNARYVDRVGATDQIVR
jgi:hypothetical protein